MEISTKFAPGDTVFVLKDSKAVKMEVKTILVTAGGKVFYTDDDSGMVFQPKAEEQCFATMDELIKYITSE